MYQLNKNYSVTADSSGLSKMERYTKEPHIFIVEHYLKNNEGLAATVFQVQKNSITTFPGYVIFGDQN